MTQESSNYTPNDPSLAADPMYRARSGRYPNQFFDISQQYMPPTIKELFRWCTYYYYNSPLIGSTLQKISRYPITDLIIEDEHESVRKIWKKVLNEQLKIKNVLMEVNLDHFVYGNAFVSTHLPFSRYLICKHCKHRHPIQSADWDFRLSGKGKTPFVLTCQKCKTRGECDVKDVPYRDISGVRIIRWNPENIDIKYNDYTGRYVYMYTVPRKLRAAILRGDKDLIEDLPLVVIEAVSQQKKIRFNNDNFRHIKMPTLAEQDQGWGKPKILHVLKDMYYMYTLRRAQEAIAMEHIVPFDIIYPMPHGQQDPFVHSDLAGWRSQIETIIKRHRNDPNYKGVIPIPVGFGRLGGDGKAMMLTPELNYLNQNIVGGMGIPQEFVFGNLNWTGSSITLRTLENDFIQNRTQLLDLTNWIVGKIKVWCDLPKPSGLRFADFRMADDVQRNQQLIGLNAQGKVSDQTMLTELGYDWEQEQKKRIYEAYLQSHIAEIQSKSTAKSQGEAMIVQNRYQERIQEMSQKAQQAAQKKMMTEQNFEMQPPPQQQLEQPQETKGVKTDVNMDPMPEKGIPRRGGEF